MIGLGYFIQRWWYRKFPPLFRVGAKNARAALSEDDYTRFALALAVAAYGLSQKKRAPKLIYATSIDTDQSFAVRVKRGRRPIARYDVIVDR
jgi:hypothetical protein